MKNILLSIVIGIILIITSSYDCAFAQYVRNWQGVVLEGEIIPVDWGGFDGNVDVSVYKSSGIWGSEGRFP